MSRFIVGFSKPPQTQVLYMRFLGDRGLAIRSENQLFHIYVAFSDALLAVQEQALHRVP